LRPVSLPSNLTRLFKSKVRYERLNLRPKVVEKINYAKKLLFLGHLFNRHLKSTQVGRAVVVKIARFQGGRPRMPCKYRLIPLSVC
jgi:hypothetical protein